MLKILLPISIATTASVMLLASSPSCNEDKKTKPQSNIEAKGKTMESTQQGSHDPVALVWQKKFVEKIDSSDAIEGYGLFSSGGWSDAGQVMVFKSASGYLVEKVGVGGKEVKKQFTLSDKQSAEFAKTIDDSKDLKSINVNAMDNIVYEFVHWKKASGGAKIVKRLFVNNPDTQPMPQHEKLIQLFKGL